MTIISDILASVFDDFHPQSLESRFSPSSSNLRAVHGGVTAFITVFTTASPYLVHFLGKGDKIIITSKLKKSAIFIKTAEKMFCLGSVSVSKFSNFKVSFARVMVVSSVVSCFKLELECGAGLFLFHGVTGP